MAVAVCPLGTAEEMNSTWLTPPPFLAHLGMKVALASACSQIWAAEWPGEETSYTAPRQYSQASRGALQQLHSEGTAEMPRRGEFYSIVVRLLLKNGFIYLTD